MILDGNTKTFASIRLHINLYCKVSELVKISALFFEVLRLVLIKTYTKLEDVAGFSSGSCSFSESAINSMIAGTPKTCFTKQIFCGDETERNNYSRFISSPKSNIRASQKNKC